MHLNPWYPCCCSGAGGGDGCTNCDDNTSADTVNVSIIIGSTQKCASVNCTNIEGTYVCNYAGGCTWTYSNTTPSMPVAHAGSTCKTSTSFGITVSVVDANFLDFELSAGVIINGTSYTDTFSGNDFGLGSPYSCCSSTHQIGTGTDLSTFCRSVTAGIDFNADGTC